MRRNARKHRRTRLNGGAILKWILIGFAVLGAAAGLYFLIRSFTLALSKRALPFRADSTHAFTGDGFMYLDGRTLVFSSLEDEDRNYTVAVDSDKVGILGTEQLKVVHSASSLQVVGTPFDNFVDGTIKKIVCGGKYVGAYIDNADGTKALRVYNSAGSQCYSRTVEGAVLLDFGFEGGKSSVFWMSELITTGSAVSTTITTYDLNRESITGVISVQGQTAKKIVLTEKSVFAFCTDSLIRFDRGTNEEAYRIRCMGYECRDWSRSGTRVLFLLHGGEEEIAPIRVLSVKEDSTADDKLYSVTEIDGMLGCCLLKGRLTVIKNDRVYENIMDEAFKDRGITTLGDYFNESIVHSIINIVSFICIYFVARILLTFLICWLDYSLRFPRLRLGDSIVGSALGLVRGFVDVLVVFMVVPILLTVLPFDSIETMITESAMASFLHTSNIFLKLIPGVV